VDPDDPMLIAENELLGAAESIEKAAKKLASLKPRREVRGKVGKIRLINFIILWVKSIFFHAKNDPVKIARYVCVVARKCYLSTLRFCPTS
jgi:hypothetical protein